MADLESSDESDTESMESEEEANETPLGEAHVGSDLAPVGASYPSPASDLSSNTDTSPEVPAEYGPEQPKFTGWTLSEWTAFYGTFSLMSWASWSAVNSPWNEREWLAVYESEQNLADPAYWGRWICGLE